MGRRFLSGSYFLNKRPYKAGFICRGCNAVRLSVAQRRVLREKNQLPPKERLTARQTEELYHQVNSSRGIDVQISSLKDHSDLPHDFPQHLDFVNYSSESLGSYLGNLDYVSLLSYNFVCARFFKPERRGTIFVDGSDEVTLESERYFRFLQYIYMDLPNAETPVYLQWSD